jgi:hypothetical protein
MSTSQKMADAQALILFDSVVKYTPIGSTEAQEKVGKKAKPGEMKSADMTTWLPVAQGTLELQPACIQHLPPNTPYKTSEDFTSAACKDAWNRWTKCARLIPIACTYPNVYRAMPRLPANCLPIPWIR